MGLRRNPPRQLTARAQRAQRALIAFWIVGTLGSAFTLGAIGIRFVHHRGLIDLWTKGQPTRGLITGLASGPLAYLEPEASPASLGSGDIVLLAELPSDLPPVAGIITIGLPGALSHVSLLARNLGIPLASVDPSIGEQLRKSVGRYFLDISR